MCGNIRDKSRIIKIVNIFIINLFIVSSVMPIGCANSDHNKQQKSELAFIDTIRYNSGRREIGMMRDSLKEGLWVSLFPDGKIASIEFFENNKWNGPFIIYYENGNICKYMDMKDNINHGKYINYYDNGQILSELAFVNDSVDGLLKSYTREGELEKIWEYEMGEFKRTVFGQPPLLMEE